VNGETAVRALQENHCQSLTSEAFEAHGPSYLPQQADPALWSTVHKDVEAGELYGMGLACSHGRASRLRGVTKDGADKREVRAGVLDSVDMLVGGGRRLSRP